MPVTTAAAAALQGWVAWMWIQAGGPSASAQTVGRQMLDERLIGYWSDEPLYQGAMEAADIAFRSDATGWTYWSRDGGTFYVDRFRWHADGRHLTLDLHEELYGTWHLKGHATRHDVRSQAASHKQVVVTYEIAAGQDALRKPATVLQFDQPISLGTIGKRFAFKRELAEHEQDPTRSR